MHFPVIHQHKINFTASPDQTFDDLYEACYVKACVFFGFTDENGVATGSSPLDITLYTELDGDKLSGHALIFFDEDDVEGDIEDDENQDIPPSRTLEDTEDIPVEATSTPVTGGKAILGATGTGWPA